MTGDQFRTTLNARPFVPFTIRTADGETCHIADPSIAWAPPTGRLAFVAQKNGSAPYPGYPPGYGDRVYR
jgi:hypothetical protein